MHMNDNKRPIHTLTHSPAVTHGLVQQHRWLQRHPVLLPARVVRVTLAAWVSNP
jgi:hypothetical protein